MIADKWQTFACERTLLSIKERLSRNGRVAQHSQAPPSTCEGQASRHQRIYCIEGKFWENCRFQRANTIAVVLGELGSALSLKEKTWMSMTPDELTTIIQSVEDALKAGFKLDCLKPVVEKAKKVLCSFNIRCRLEALQKEKSSLETQLQTVISQLQSLELDRTPKDLI
ncbi:uncharacterized protein LOC122724928 [Manihot esculenta]|uniref:uncharacterized protein LOC122724928 n=1 Tax=Manihot esculenta TaxID=3983 RepID=UPI001CC33447|nr:uncharacterized protein LOC122724928 [Manihot esculenta]